MTLLRAARRRQALPVRGRGDTRRRPRRAEGRGAGEMLAVHGPSGSGKTTLLLLMAGLLRARRRHDPLPRTRALHAQRAGVLGPADARGRLHLPEHPAAAARHGARERRAQADARRGRHAPRPGPRKATPATTRSRREAQADTRGALRRRAPTRGDRPRARLRAQADPRRRADRQPRQPPQPRSDRSARRKRTRAETRASCSSPTTPRRR